MTDNKEKIYAFTAFFERQRYIKEVELLKEERDSAEEEESRLAKLCFAIEEKPWDEPLTDEEKATEEAYDKARAAYRALDDKIWWREQLIDALDKVTECLDNIEQET